MAGMTVHEKHSAILAGSSLLAQRSRGSVHLRVTQTGIDILREEGSSKCRMPRGSRDAILINVSGGLAGGDTVTITAEAADNAQLSLTSQAAERVYKTIGPPAKVEVTLKAGPNASLFWLPQETILFEGSAISRKLNVSLADNATFLAAEMLIFGRHEMGERLQQVSVLDRWYVSQKGHLIHAEALKTGPNFTSLSKARLSENLATATVLLVSPQAEALVDPVRAALGPTDGASSWNGKLVARLLAKDSFHLRKRLVQVLSLCAGETGLPKCWTF
jgi:urease accessory protein